MDNTPEVMVRDGTRGKNKKIGKELDHAHKLLCQLRHAGATWDDLVAMRDANLEIFSEFLARLRGIPATDDRKSPVDIINLDYEPGSFESIAGLFLGSTLEIDENVQQPNTIDDRLGIWPLIEESETFVFGNMKFAVEKPTGGTCVKEEPLRYCCGDLLGLSKDCVYLNLAMATWLSQGGRIDVPFDCPPFVEWGDDTIFFLGTVWWMSSGKEGTYFAPAFTSNHEKHIKFEIKPIPAGKWPENCYVALLVPR